MSVFFLRLTWPHYLLTNKQQLKIKGNELSGSLQVFSNYKDIEDSIKKPVKGTLKAKLKNGLLQNGDFPLKAKSGYSIKTMNFKLSECNTKSGWQNTTEIPKVEKINQGDL